MFCTKCGRQLHDGDAFCAYCGNKVRRDDTGRRENKYSDIVFNPPFKLEAQRRTEEISKEIEKYSSEPKKDSVEFDWNLDGFPGSRPAKKDDDFKFNWDDVLEKKNRNREVDVEKIVPKQEESHGKAFQSEEAKPSAEKAGNAPQSLSIEELERELFGEAPSRVSEDAERELEMTLQYKREDLEDAKNKFHTYNVKRDAFQELLDREKARIEEMKEARDEQWRAISPREEKVQISKEPPAFEDIFVEPKIFRGSYLHEVGVAMPPKTSVVIAEEKKTADSAAVSDVKSAQTVQSVKASTSAAPAAQAAQSAATAQRAANTASAAKPAAVQPAKPAAVTPAAAAAEKAAPGVKPAQTAPAAQSAATAQTAANTASAAKPAVVQPAKSAAVTPAVAAAEKAAPGVKPAQTAPAAQAAQSAATAQTAANTASAAKPAAAQPAKPAAVTPAAAAAEKAAPGVKPAQAAPAAQSAQSAATAQRAANTASAAKPAAVQPAKPAAVTPAAAAAEKAAPGVKPAQTAPAAQSAATAQTAANTASAAKPAAVQPAKPAAVTPAAAAGANVSQTAKVQDGKTETVGKKTAETAKNGEHLPKEAQPGENLGKETAQGETSKADANKEGAAARPFQAKDGGTDKTGKSYSADTAENESGGSHKEKTKLRFSDVFPIEAINADSSLNDGGGDTSGKKEKTKDVQPEEYDDEDEKRKNPVLKVIIIILAVLVALEIIIIGIKFAAPESGFSKGVDKLIGSVTDVFTGDKNVAENDGEPVTETTYITEYINDFSGNSADIGSVSENTDLKYDPDKVYSFDEISDTSEFQNGVWKTDEEDNNIYIGQKIVESIISYYNDMKKEGTLAEGTVGINKLEIGEIRTGDSGYYVLTKLAYAQEEGGETVKYESVHLTASSDDITVKEVEEENL